MATAKNSTSPAQPKRIRKAPPTYTQIGGLCSTVVGVCMVGFAITSPSGINPNTERRHFSSLQSSSTTNSTFATTRLDESKWEALESQLQGGDLNEADAFAAELLAVYPLITPSSPVDVLDLNGLPTPLVSLLQALLEDQDAGRPDDPTRWIDFDQPPTNLVELVVQGIFYPLVKGADTAGGEDPIRGADWWFEQRYDDSPVSYHADNDKPRRCQANTNVCGVPVFSSEFYLSDVGGPSVMFHQEMTLLGLNPALPSRASVVGPQAGRLAVFNSSLYHGVLQTPPDSGTLAALSGKHGEGARLKALEAAKRASEDSELSPARQTLRVNYWRRKPAGAKEIPDLATPEKTTLYMEKGIKVIETYLSRAHGNPITALQRVPLQQVEPERGGYTFSRDLETWQSLNLPEWAAHTYSNTQDHSRVFSYKYADSQTDIDVDKGQMVPDWMHWTDQ